jgi:hypothetical protein
MQLSRHRFSRGILIAALVAAAPAAFAAVAQHDVMTNPEPVDQVLGHASGDSSFESFAESRPEVSPPRAVSNALDKAVQFLTQPPKPVAPDRFGRGGGNLPAGG